MVKHDVFSQNKKCAIIDKKTLSVKIIAKITESVLQDVEKFLLINPSI